MIVFILFISLKSFQKCSFNPRHLWEGGPSCLWLTAELTSALCVIALNLDLNSHEKKICHRKKQTHTHRQGAPLQTQEHPIKTLPPLGRKGESMCDEAFKEWVHCDQLRHPSINQTRPFSFSCTDGRSVSKNKPDMYLCWRGETPWCGQRRSAAALHISECTETRWGRFITGSTHAGWGRLTPCH